MVSCVLAGERERKEVVRSHHYPRVGLKESVPRSRRPDLWMLRSVLQKWSQFQFVQNLKRNIGKHVFL